MTDELPEQGNADPGEMAEDEFDESYDPDSETPGAGDEESAGPPGPVNWNLLTADAAEEEWLALNEWVHWLRHTYGLPVAVIPPFWHCHPELVWELSALHIHWLCAIHPEAKGSAMLVWHRDFADARERLRDWTSVCGTRLNTDRPTRQIVWPGEEPSSRRGRGDPEPRGRLRGVHARRWGSATACRGSGHRRSRPEHRRSVVRV